MRNAELITTRFSQLLYGRGDELDWLEKEFNGHDQSVALFRSLSLARPASARLPL